MERPLTAWLVDDEPLAITRLKRLIEEDGRLAIAGSTSDPEEAVRSIAAASPDVVFLDIQMPALTGFEVLASLPSQPLVVFTTAYNQYALQAFEVNSIDYLLKPVDPQHLERAINKLERMIGARHPRPDITRVLDQLAAAVKGERPRYPARLPSRIGERVQFVELSRVTHIYARDKLTFAAAAGRDYCIDATIAELEERLDPEKFVRVHRSTIVNIEYVHELFTWFGGKLLVRLNDPKKTELTVARDRVRAIKEKLGL
ncbi:MAG TPA: LytTR family DNA-binding domain-containing protein [Bryobacteraceae bacterium]|nr:LytTR family DNA-binding domain-containing protein [Bryobacteraceae bacterium]